MRKKAKEYVPKDIQEAAKETDAKTPLWYLGRPNRDVKIVHGLGHVVAKAREEAGLPPPTLVDSSSEEVKKDD